MANKKNNGIILTCTECLSRNYTTSRNKVNQIERLELMKFCEKCNKHTLHKETKQEARVMEWLTFSGIKEEIKKTGKVSEKLKESINAVIAEVKKEYDYSQEVFI